MRVCHVTHLSNKIIKVHLQRHHLVHQQTGTTEVQNSPIAPLLPQIDSVEPVRQYLLISTNQSNNFQSAKLLSQTVGNIRTVYPPVEQSASTKTLLNKPEMGQKIKPKTNLKNKVDVRK